MVKRVVIGLCVGLVLIQFIRPHPNVAPGPPGPNDLIVRYDPPPAIRQILATACYDCHSDHTRYPWYANVQPVGWWLAEHVRDGKRALNFSEFGAYSTARQAHKLDQIGDQMTEHSMPLKSYTWIHTDARLTAAQIGAVTDWTDALHDRIAPDE